MDYFTNLLATFLDVDRDYYIAVYGRAKDTVAERAQRAATSENTCK